MRAESASAQLQLASCTFLNCWANGAERLIRVKAGRKMPKNLWNYMHLSVLQGKTSLLQIVIHSFLLLFHRVYFLFCWPFQLILSFKTLFAIRFWPYLSSVFCIGPFKYTGPIAIALSLYVCTCCQLRQSQCSAHNQISPHVLTMEDAYEVRILNTFTRRRQWKMLMKSRLHFTHFTL